MLATAGVLAVLGGMAGLAVLKAGWYDVAATRQHWQPVHTLLESGMRESVRHHARNIETPAPGDAGSVRQGAILYRSHCMQCHGAPGEAPASFGMSMQPVPGPLIDAARHWRTRELYWITRYGIRMSGMPAWEFHLSEREMWDVVAFLSRLPALSPSEYADLADMREKPP